MPELCVVMVKMHVTLRETRAGTAFGSIQNETQDSMTRMMLGIITCRR